MLYLAYINTSLYQYTFKTVLPNPQTHNAQQEYLSLDSNYPLL